MTALFLIQVNPIILTGNDKTAPTANKPTFSTMHADWTAYHTNPQCHLQLRKLTCGKSATSLYQYIFRNGFRNGFQEISPDGEL